jgi:SAM-dependent methyltransferase
MDVHPPLQALDTKFVPSDHLSSYQNEQFDLVLASAVIEHLKRPGEVLQSLYESCAEYGFLYFRIPSNFPLGKLSKRLMLFPEHLSHLGPRFWDVIPKLLGWSVKLEYSRPSIADAPFTANPIAALGSAIFKLPANVEVSIRQLLRNPSVARYECAGGWEVMYQRVAPASRSLNRESTR